MVRCARITRPPPSLRRDAPRTTRRVKRRPRRWSSRCRWTRGSPRAAIRIRRWRACSPLPRPRTAPSTRAPTDGSWRSRTSTGPASKTCRPATARSSLRWPRPASRPLAESAGAGVGDGAADAVEVVREVTQMLVHRLGARSLKLAAGEAAGQHRHRGQARSRGGQAVPRRVADHDRRVTSRPRKRDLDRFRIRFGARAVRRRGRCPDEVLRIEQTEVVLHLMPLGRADQHHHHVASNQTFQQVASVRQRRHLIADRGEVASVLIDRLLRNPRSIGLPEQLLEQPPTPHADQPVRTGRGDIEPAGADRRRPRAGMQVGGVDQRAVDVDQRRRSLAGVDALGHVSGPSASQAQDRVPAPECLATVAQDPAQWAAWAARGSAATDPAAPASAARPAAEARTTLAWQPTTRAGEPRNPRPPRRVGAGRSAGPNLRRYGVTLSTPLLSLSAALSTPSLRSPLAWSRLPSASRSASSVS